MRSVLFIASAMLLALLVAGCGGSPTVQPAPPVAKTGAQEPAASTWIQQWDKLVAAARNEGQVVIASSVGPSVRDALSHGFTGKYGVNLEFVTGKPAEIIPKVQAERRIGLYLVDLFLAGSGTVVPLLGADGALEPLTDALMLPEVVDGKNWWGGQLLWDSPKHLQVIFSAAPDMLLEINGDLVKEGDIKSFYDLLLPRWKGKIGFFDPTIAGGGNTFFVYMGEVVKDLDYLRALGKQDLAFTSDSRLLAEWVARGKYPVSIGLKGESATEFRKAGASIKTVPTVEGTPLSASGGGLALMNKAPHPNAAKLFINWLLSREGQTVSSRARGIQSAREDVPTDSLDSEGVRKPGLKYFALIGDVADQNRAVYMKMARDMYGPLMK
ncbi:MAG: extracellular solute-binding protein [Chloroflexi bacterium]|nr:extracellular solute-binding protein [Chloroflexota bacterium]